MINEILKFDNQNYFWLKIARKIARIKRVYFVPISKNILPKKNYPLKNLNNFFRKQLLNFQNKIDIGTAGQKVGESFGKLKKAWLITRLSIAALSVPPLGQV